MGAEAGVFNLYSQEKLKAAKAIDGTDIEALSQVKIYTGSWAFSGMPLVHGYCGSLNCQLNVKRIDDLPVNESLFDTEILAREAYKYLELTVVNNCDEPVLDDPFDLTRYSWPNFLAPINWQWLRRGENEWLYFEEQPLASGPMNVTWIMAISDRHYITCGFSIIKSALNSGNPYRIEQSVSSNNFLAFMHKIMDSFEIELSSTAKAERERVKLKIPQPFRPIISCTVEQVAIAKQVLHHYSSHGYRNEVEDPVNGHRADPKDIAAFVDERVKPKPLPGNHLAGSILNEK